MSKSSTKGRDISRTGGDFKHIDAAVSPETASKRIKQEFEKKTVYYAENQEKRENNRNLQVTRSVAFLLSPTDFCDTMKL